MTRRKLPRVGGAWIAVVVRRKRFEVHCIRGSERVTLKGCAGTAEQWRTVGNDVWTFLCRHWSPDAPIADVAEDMLNGMHARGIGSEVTP